MNQIGLPNASVQIELGDKRRVITSSLIVRTPLWHVISFVYLSDTQVVLFSCYLQV